MANTDISKTKALDYVYSLLNENNNAVISRENLMKYGEEQIIAECIKRGFHVYLRVSEPYTSEAKKKQGKKSKYPIENTYIIEKY